MGRVSRHDLVRLEPRAVLDTTLVTGSNPRPKNCKPVSGRVEVCNASYGNTGWLGIAQIWVNGGHITQGVTKLDDYYFNTVPYNTLGVAPSRDVPESRLHLWPRSPG